jgi:YHS domain-containing protein
MFTFFRFVFSSLDVKGFSMFKKSIVAIAAVAVVCFAYSVNAEKKEAAAKAVCPVSGKACSPDHSSDYKDGKVNFCCPKCKAAFDADSTKFAAKANLHLVASKQYKQAKCPVAGRPCNPEHTVAVAGLKVAFCCPNCKGKVAKAEGDAQLNLVFSDAAFAKGFVKKD